MCSVTIKGTIRASDLLYLLWRRVTFVLLYRTFHAVHGQPSMVVIDTVETGPARLFIAEGNDSRGRDSLVLTAMAASRVSVLQ